MEKDIRLHSPGEGRPKNSTQIISLGVGFILFALGLCGFMYPGFAGLHLGPLYSFSIFLSGILLIYNGYRNNGRDAFVTTFGFSIFYGIHAFAGWVFGSFGLPTVGNQTPAPNLLKIIPGFHEVARTDHILNTILMLVLAGGAFDWWRRSNKRKSVLRVVRDYFRDHRHERQRPIRH